MILRGSAGMICHLENASKKRLKIPIRRRTDNTMAKRNRTHGQIMIY
jgi:hypothetical protein